jgi:hypothetical protein
LNKFGTHDNNNQKKKKTARHKETIFFDKMLTDFTVGRNKKSLKDLKGKISFRNDYDYKLMRG